MSDAFLVRDKRSFILGMELALRIVRNHRSAIAAIQDKDDITDPKQQLVATTEAMIRIVQVEIGAGRSELPQNWTDEEIDEVRRIR